MFVCKRKEKVTCDGGKRICKFFFRCGAIHALEIGVGMWPIYRQECDRRGRREIAMSATSTSKQTNATKLGEGYHAPVTTQHVDPQQHSKRSRP